jgi:hypothetical protein
MKWIRSVFVLMKDVREAGLVGRVGHRAYERR